mmetsp:Transcript_8138/g.23359  ORF Transcript_8138/g.23359 Transcript_8138/m.23359 type:complete len:192 (-) Transcript_8138:74-649(-)
MATTREVQVRLNHYGTIEERKGDRYVKVRLAADGSESVADLKKKISVALYNSIPPEEIKVMFGPNDVHIGKEYIGDPYIDEAKLMLSQFSFLKWVERFPSWYLTAKALASAPPPPGVAETMAASTLESDITPEEAVKNARKEGKLPRMQDLQKPWGAKPVPAVKESRLVSLKKLPAQYPKMSDPSIYSVSG